MFAANIVMALAWSKGRKTRLYHIQKTCLSSAFFASILYLSLALTLNSGVF